MGTRGFSANQEPVVTIFFFSSRRRYTSWNCDWSSDVCSSDLSPVGEICHLGFAPDCTAAEKRRLASALIARLIDFAERRRIGMIAVKDASGADDALWSAVCGDRKSVV